MRHVRGASSNSRAPRTPRHLRTVLDEIRDTGYAGTELGDWGFMPTEPARLQARARGAPTDAGRRVRAGGACRPGRPRCRRRDRGPHRRAAARRRRARTRSSSLSDDNASVPEREQHAGRITARAWAVSDRQWDVFAAGADHVARAVRERDRVAHGVSSALRRLRRNAAEIDALMRRTDPARLGWCLDTGHIVYGGGDPLRVLDAARDPRLARAFQGLRSADCRRQARAQGLGYLAAVRSQLFCELGAGAVDFAAVHCRAAALRLRRLDRRRAGRVSRLRHSRQRARRRAATTCDGWACDCRGCVYDAAHALDRRAGRWKSPLHEMTQTTATCLWNDSADLDELR